MNTKETHVEFVDRGTFNWKEIVKSAEHDIFISGTTLNQYVSGASVFEKINRSICVKFLVLNLCNDDDLNAFRRMRYKDNTIHTNERYIKQGDIFEELYCTLKNKENIFFAVSDRIMPITFVAVDIEKITTKSMIRVQHYLYEKEADTATISYIVTPEDTLFDLFKEEIQYLWKYALKDKKDLYFCKESDRS